MIGNDIVDLEAAAVESNWRRPGFIQKLFTLGEQEVIGNAGDPTHCVWLMWTMKESAYKLVFRRHRERRFNPQDFECVLTEPNGSSTGYVVNNGSRLYTSSSAASGYIHTSCVLDAQMLTNIQIGIFRNRKALEALNYQKDKDGIPYITPREGESKRYISISHHGRFCSYISTQNRELTMQ